MSLQFRQGGLLRPLVNGAVRLRGQPFQLLISFDRRDHALIMQASLQPAITQLANAGFELLTVLPVYARCFALVAKTTKACAVAGPSHDAALFVTEHAWHCWPPMNPKPAPGAGAGGRAVCRHSVRKVVHVTDTGPKSETTLRRLVGKTIYLVAATLTRAQFAQANRNQRVRVKPHSIRLRIGP